MTKEKKRLPTPVKGLVLMIFDFQVARQRVIVTRWPARPLRKFCGYKTHMRRITTFSFLGWKPFFSIDIQIIIV